MEFENRMLLGDAYELIKQVPDKSVDLIVTDPPYLIQGMTVCKTSGVLKDHKKSFVEELLEDEGRIVAGIDLGVLPEFVRIMKKINIYIWCNKEQIMDYMDFFVKGLGCNFEFLIWAKDDPTPFCGTHYLKDKEYCLYFWESGAKVRIPYERGKTVFRTTKNVADKKLYDHPTIKPLQIISALIENSSEEGDFVLDPFSGSGTTCAAAKELGRKYCGFEISENYWKICVDRLNGITQKDRKAGAAQLKLF